LADCAPDELLEGHGIADLLTNAQRRVMDISRRMRNRREVGAVDLDKDRDPT
jgi:hypothetical protein